MIRTVTLNTGFDEIYRVERVEFGGVARLLSHQSLPSGKGINAARAVAALGQPVAAYGLVGRRDCERFQESLWESGVEPHLVPVESSTRRNVTLLSEDPDTVAPHFVAPGFALPDESAIDELRASLAGDILPGDIVILNGSLPVGANPATWARLGTTVHSLGASVLLDIQGEALRIALNAVACHVCKPNAEEVLALVDDTANPAPDRLRAALRYMLDRSVGLPVITLGKGGVVFASKGRIWEARCPVERPRLVVGAGDALMAGMAVAVDRQLPTEAVVRAGLSAAAAHVEGRQGPSLAFRAGELSSRAELREGPPL